MPSSLHSALAVLLALTPITLAPAQDAAAVASADRPNILFIFSDDHAPHAIGAYREHLDWGGWLDGVDATPRIDRLASEGVLFSRSFCANSICGPSRANILTGLHSHANGFLRNGDQFDGDQRTFPKLLQAAGYSTAMIGKWHLRSDPQGFDHWEVLPGQGQYYNPVLRSAEGRRTIEGNCTDIVADLAVAWLEAQEDLDEPWLRAASWSTTRAAEGPRAAAVTAAGSNSSRTPSRAGSPECSTPSRSTMRSARWSRAPSAKRGSSRCASAAG